MNNIFPLKFQIVVLLISSLVCVSQASVIGATIVGPPAPGVLIRGPVVRSSVLGPDGSAILAAAQAGAVAAPPIAGGVVRAAVPVIGAVPVAVGH